MEILGCFVSLFVCQGFEHVGGRGWRNTPVEEYRKTVGFTSAVTVGNEQWGSLSGSQNTNTPNSLGWRCLFSFLESNVVYVYGSIYNKKENTT